MLLTFEAQIRQWPINTFSPANTNMYLFMFGEDIAGPGKRRVREAFVQKDVALAETDIAVRARDLGDRVKRADAELFLARKAVEVHHAGVDLLRQLADVAQVKYTTGRISQQDVLQAVLELSRVHDHLITLNEQAQLAEAQLNTLPCACGGVAYAPCGRSADPARARPQPTSRIVRLFQKLLEPLAIRYTGDHLLRDPLDHVTDLGFSIEYCARSRAGIVERVVARKPTAEDHSAKGGYDRE